MGETPLIEASSSHIKVVERLLRAGADVNAEMLDGRTVLWMAINGGNVQIVETLLTAGANVTGEHGHEVIQKAVEVGHYEIFKILLVAGAWKCYFLPDQA